MDADFWLDRWLKSEIGFHQNEINLHLQKFWPLLNLPSGSRVFVPLCGKSRDMVWLHEQGHDVMGVEMSPIAVEAFFSENSIPFSVTKYRDFSKYQTDGFTLYCGDFFHLLPEDMRGVNAVFDRGSLIALPPSMRCAYARQMHAILPHGCKILLVTLDYPQHEMNGPPFSVGELEVSALYAETGNVQLLHGADILDRETRFREKGLTRLFEKVYLVTHNPG